jgi:hypothetical protein
VRAPRSTATGVLYGEIGWSRAPDLNPRPSTFARHGPGPAELDCRDLAVLAYLLAPADAGIA